MMIAVVVGLTLAVYVIAKLSDRWRNQTTLDRGKCPGSVSRRTLPHPSVPCRPFFTFRRENAVNSSRRILN
jgi:hypothetical protein